MSGLRKTQAVCLITGKSEVEKRIIYVEKAPSRYKDNGNDNSTPYRARRARVPPKKASSVSALDLTEARYLFGARAQFVHISVGGAGGVTG